MAKSKPTNRELIAIARQVTKAQNEQNEAKLKELLAPGFKSHISDQEKPLSREQYIKGVKMSHQAFSNLIFSIEDVVADKDKVVLRILAKGKHTGKYQGIAPTQKLVKFAGIVIRRIKDGRVVEEWQTNDQFSLQQQLISDSAL
jgi:predicted ester cyclase